MFKIMKKLIFLSAALFIFATSCRSNEGEIDPADRTEQTVIVEVFFVNSEGVETAPTGDNFSTVHIFEDADFDFGILSERSMQETPQRMTLIDGTEVDHIFLNPQYWQPGMGVNRHVFNDVPNGEYFIVIGIVVQGSGGYVRGYRRVTVDQHIHEVVQRIVFTDEDRNDVPDRRWFFREK